MLPPLYSESYYALKAMEDSERFLEFKCNCGNITYTKFVKNGVDKIRCFKCNKLLVVLTNKGFLRPVR
jgi:hypothetical protein